MNEFIKVLIERLEEELRLADEVKEKCARENPLMFDNAKGYSTGVSNAIHIVNQLAEEHKDISNIIADLKIFLQEKFDYCAEQSLMNLEAEGNSEIASYFRERKELYLDRANIYGEVMREIDRLAEEHNNGWIPCSERLPEFAKENPATKDFYKYPCIYKNGDVVDIRYIAFGRGNWVHGGKVMNDYVVAWFDIFSTLPVPYQPKGE